MDSQPPEDAPRLTNREGQQHDEEAAIAANERQAQAEAEAKRQVAQEIERERLRFIPVLY